MRTTARFATIALTLVGCSTAPPPDAGNTDVLTDRAMVDGEPPRDASALDALDDDASDVTSDVPEDSRGIDAPSLDAAEDVASSDASSDASRPDAPATDSATPVPCTEREPVPLRRLSARSLAEVATLLSSAMPGDEITLAAGTYNATSTTTIRAVGTCDRPIVLRAPTPGAVTITGSPPFALTSTRYFTLTGFNFRHTVDASGGTDQGLVITSAQFTRISRNDFQLSAASGSTDAANWVVLTGAGSADNRVDHNSFHDRTTQGVFFVIYGPTGGMSLRDRVDHNYFANHTYSGSNGGESIRIGDSNRQSASAQTVIEDNLFENCRGDVEVVSIKSTDDVVRHNTLRNCRGSITLRHGNTCTVDGNFVLGGESGVRSYGNGHRIINNYLSGSTGTGLRASIVVGSGDFADTMSGNNAHDRSDDTIVAFNTVLANASGISIGDGSYPMAPLRTVVASNVVVNETGTLVATMGSPSGTIYATNILFGAAANGSIPAAGFLRVDPALAAMGGVSRPVMSSPTVDAAMALRETVFVDHDLNGATRGATRDIGADELPLRSPRVPLQRTDVGPAAP